MTTESFDLINNQDEQRLRALYHLSVELSALQPLESVLSTALKHCLDLTGSQFGFVGLVSASAKAMDVVEVQGFHAEASFYKHFHLIPLRPSIFARAVLDNHPVRSLDARIDPLRVGQPQGHPQVVTFLGVPLRHRDHPIGMIGVANRSTPYEQEHEHLLMTYASQIAIVISNAQLYEELTKSRAELEQKVFDRTYELQEAKEALAQKATQLQQLYNETITIQENERQRIAQDMHDGINQLLIGAMLELKSARERLSAGNTKLADDSLDSVYTILHDVEAEIKRIVYDIRPPILDTLGFLPALRRYCQDFNEYAHINCNLQAMGKVAKLPEWVEVSIYRLFQEALQNVYHHAQAQTVDICIRFTPKNLELQIMDDGIGFDYMKVQRNNHHRFGLISMQERAINLNGDLSIITGHGEGTCITLKLPIERRQA